MGRQQPGRPPSRRDSTAAALDWLGIGSRERLICHQLELSMDRGARDPERRRCARPAVDRDRPLEIGPREIEPYEIEPYEIEIDV